MSRTQTNRRVRPDPGHPLPIERRGAPRYPALENASLVGWHRAEQLETTDAQVMDVSRGGLLVLADDEPAREGPVLVRLLTPTITAWVELWVVESRRMRLGPYQLRLAFRGDPPDDFLAAVNPRLAAGH